MLLKLLPVLIALNGVSSCDRTRRAGSEDVAYRRNLVALEARVDELAAAVGTNREARAQNAFLNARLAYKRVEHYAEHYYPATARLINGPAIAEIADDDPTKTVKPPEGFQVVEALLFPEITRDTAMLRVEVAVLRANVTKLITFAAVTPLTRENSLDAARYQLLRIGSLGISGFDSPIARASMREAAASVRAVGITVLAAGGDDVSPTLRKAVSLAFDNAARVLAGSPDFDSFDRLGFIRDQLMPLHRGVELVSKAADLELEASPRAWRTAAATPYDANAFDVSFFSPQRAADSPLVVSLGESLFHDPLLGNGRSCASCHDPERAFSDGRRKAVALAGGVVERNTPTIINAGLQAGSFYDLRTAYLEDQVADVLQSPLEMNTTLAAAAARLETSGLYEDRFAAAFDRESSTIGTREVQSAVAAYMRSLVALNARFDQYLRGSDAALSAAERRGFNTFMGKGKCGTCHFSPLFSGAVPPVYNDVDVEVLGVPERYDTTGARIDPDEGRYRVYRNPLHRFAFRTPTLRNSAVTAPYMHNGAFETLEEVVDFYNRGGGAGIGIKLENQTLPPEPLNLTPREQQELIAFLHALTDTAYASSGAAGSLAVHGSTPRRH